MIFLCATILYYAQKCLGIREGNDLFENILKREIIGWVGLVIKQI